MSSYAASMKCSGKAALHVRSTCLVPSVSHEGADWSQWRGGGGDPEVSRFRGRSEAHSWKWQCWNLPSGPL